MKKTLTSLALAAAFGALALPAQAALGIDAGGALQRAERPEKTEKPEKAEKPEKVGALESLSGKLARAERPEKTEKPEKAEKVGALSGGTIPA